MSNQTPEKERTAGFLQPNERAYLAENHLYPEFYDESKESGGKRAKSRIKNEVAAGPEFENIVESFHNDLLAVVNLQLQADTQEKITWRTVGLKPAKPKLEALRDHLDTLIELAENDDIWSERDELQKALTALNEPDPLPNQNVMSEAGEMPNEKTLEEVFNQRREMRKHLQRVLDRDGRIEILEYLNENGKSDLSGRNIGDDGEPWARVASRELEPELVIQDWISKRRQEYEITEKGEAILECWSALRNIRAVSLKQDLNPEKDDQEIILELLADYFRDFRSE